MQLIRATRKSFEGSKQFLILFFKQNREEYPDSHKYVAAKGTRMHRTFVHNFW